MFHRNINLICSIDHLLKIWIFKACKIVNEGTKHLPKQNDQLHISTKDLYLGANDIGLEGALLLNLN